MNQHDLSEIRRRLNPDKRNPSVICGCYVDHIGNPIASFSVPVATLYEQENIAYMAIFKKVLSGLIVCSYGRGIPRCRTKRRLKNSSPA